MKNENDTYDMASGPASPKGAGRKTSFKAYRMPVDLTRSRRHGLTRIVCRACGAPYDQGICRHDASMPHGDAPYERVRIKTGPMLANETSNDTGWMLDTTDRPC